MLIMVANYLTLALALFAVVFVLKLYKLTAAKSILVLAAAYLWTAIIRASILFDIVFLSENARPLTVITLTFHAIGVYLLYRAMKKYYRGNGDSARSVIDNFEKEEAAKLVVKLAALAAASTVEATAEAAAAALAAKEKATETRILAETIEKHVIKER
jgi:hypothetical protein